MTFADRQHAGQVLAEHLVDEGVTADIVLGLPRGGVPVAAEVAAALDVPLDVLVVRKLGVPFQPELAMGAIASGGATIIDHDTIRRCAIHEEDVQRVVERERAELERRERAYRGERAPLDVAGARVVVVDDGLATGATMRAAVAALRSLGPASVIVAVPVGAAETVRALATEVDRVVCALTPTHFAAVGQWYDDFSPTTDETVRSLVP